MFRGGQVVRSEQREGRVRRSATWERCCSASGEAIFTARPAADGDVYERPSLVMRPLRCEGRGHWMPSSSARIPPGIRRSGSHSPRTPTAFGCGHLGLGD